MRKLRSSSTNLYGVGQVDEVHGSVMGGRPSNGMGLAAARDRERRTLAAARAEGQRLLRALQGAPSHSAVPPMRWVPIPPSAAPAPREVTTIGSPPGSPADVQPVASEASTRPVQLVGWPGFPPHETHRSCGGPGFALVGRDLAGGIAPPAPPALSVLRPQHRSPGGPRPSGVGPIGAGRREDGTFQPAAQATRDLVAEVYSLIGSAAGTARELNVRDVPAPRGGRWYDSSVRYLLRQPSPDEPRLTRGPRQGAGRS